MITIEHKLQLRSRKIVAYTKFSGTHFRTEAQRESAKLNLTSEDPNAKKPYSGEICPGARKRLIKAIDLLVQSTKRTWIKNPVTDKWMPFQLGFITLTIHNPGVFVTGKEGHKNLLGPFLQWLRRSHNCYLYIWKAEKQMQREDVNQLHYHLLLGKFVPYKELEAKWNELQQKAGYLDTYYQEHGDYNAPSTEVRNALDHEDVAGYLIKEISKGIQNQTSITGKVWDCSMNLKEIGFFELDKDKYQSTINALVSQNKIYVAFSDKACTVYKSKEDDVLNLMKLGYKDGTLYKEHIRYLQRRNVEDQSIVKPKREKPKAAWQLIENEQINTVQLSKQTAPLNIFSLYNDVKCEVILTPEIYSSS